MFANLYDPCTNQLSYNVLAEEFKMPVHEICHPPCNELITRVLLLLLINMRWTCDWYRVGSYPVQCTCRTGSTDCHVGILAHFFPCKRFASFWQICIGFLPGDAYAYLVVPGYSTPGTQLYCVIP
jgi:hypothetical protein